MHSCESAINYVIAEWKEALDRGETIFAIFIDMKRAFESGFDELANKLMKSYLSGRRQRVKIGEILSDLIFNEIGVPQGSKIRPIVSLMYIDLLKYCLRFCRCKFFADDTLIWLPIKNVTVGEALVNIDLRNLYRMLNQLKLCSNTDKTKYMIISNKKI